MRPNIDIDWSLHGKVKELADSMGWGIEETYEEVIYTGANSVPGDDETNIQIHIDTYTALDRLRDGDESFDSIIRRMVDQGTDVTVETFSTDPPEMETGEVEPIPDDVEPDAGCAHYDVIESEECGNTVEFRQKYRFTDGGDWEWFYYCPDHAPGGE